VPVGLGVVGVDGVLAHLAVQHAQDLHEPQAVDDAVVHLEHVGRSPALQPGDDPRFPRRALAVERGQGHRRREVEELTPSTGALHLLAAEVVREREVRVGHPGRRAPVTPRLQNALAQARHEARRPLVGREDPVPLRRGVQDVEDDDRRPQPRVDLGAPHHGLERVHLARSADQIAGPARHAVLSGPLHGGP
jgi:hypothetical protein